tara:strand:+ start:89 stop:394 length:306 start_codon:yes stop_codon:yes gene_type:complete
MKSDQDQFNVLRSLDKEKNISQRKLASRLGYSLGKLNYLINALKKKGFIKINRFKKNKEKIGYIYILTPSGITKRTKYALTFMKRQMKEYEELKKDISKYD